MDLVRDASGWMLILSWLLFSGLLAWNHARVRAERRKRGIAEERTAIRNPRSMHGLVLEGLAFAVALLFTRPLHESAPWQQAGSILFGITAVVVLFLALRHLDLEWRIKAVVTEDHRLVTTGPYSVIRHPVFSSLFCLLLATVLLLDPPWAAAASLAICIYGTEIRIRAEDSLLRRRFGARFESYRSRVAAYVPYVR
ncbi:MAG: isoprenylcysteine carboxylmethyltransferase family protein [Bryobacterales bacterium]|nr:isoprenylcysteine carboxylmethyltransferase family protein [Bryobacterales bacterium]